MRRILLVLSILSAAACNDRGRGLDADIYDPLSECVMPEAARAGEEVIVQWSGFEDASRISLVSEDGSGYETEVVTVTASGLIFRIPAQTPPGSYMVVEQPADRQLGLIRVDEAEAPVTGLNVPSGMKQGEIANIEGVGFEEGCVVIFIDGSGKEYAFDTELTYSGVSFIVPSELLPGEYEVYYEQSGVRWLAASSVAVYEELVIKTLRRIDYIAPYIGDALLRLSWDISTDDPVTLTVSEYVVEGDTESLEVYDRYVCGEDGWFELVNDGFEESNDLKMFYERDSDGTVVRADVLIYGNKQATSFSWTYDGDGFLTEIASPSRPLRSLSYEQGNLTVFRNTIFEYSDPSLVNDPSAPDVVWGYMSLMEKNDPFIYFPYFLGWYDRTSALLPSAMVVPSPSGTGNVTHPLTYTFDDDGYVTSMSWDSYSVRFIY
ncbi:MAG: hypothetical protein IJE85_04960 [Bacteroidales bacterium]|nr:hypothetical protein [Bacteroidales bacterium]